MKETKKQTVEEVVHNILSKFAKKKGLVKYEYPDGFYVFGNPDSRELADKKHEEWLIKKINRKITMTKAELNAHWSLPDETLKDSYTITHKREREAFVKGWYKAVELCCEWLYQRQVIDLEVPNIEKFIEDFKQAMEGE